MPILTAGETASLLGISVATLRNWHRAGHLPAARGAELRFAERDVLALADGIRAGRFPRLRSRANKTAVTSNSRAAFSDPSLAEAAEALAGLPLDNSLFLAALAQLHAAGEAKLSNSEPGRLARADAWHRQAVGETVAGWRRRLGHEVDLRNRDALAAAARTAGTDFLGELYQGLAGTGDRIRRGGYLTPFPLVDAALDGMGGRPTTFLDPCCGSGRFLVRAARKWGLDLADVYGIDIDPVAVDIARLNLLLLFPECDAQPRVVCADALAGFPAFPAAPDAIATNPPWGGRRGGAKPTPPEGSRVVSGEPFSLFLESSFRLLAAGGRLSFLLPESVLAVKTHTDIRGILTEEARILRITRLAERFAGVFTPVVRLDAEKASPGKGWRVEVAEGGAAVRHVRQARFAANPGHVFDLGVSDRDEAILERLKLAGRLSLKDNAEWALGIVTGDNRRLVLDRPAPGAEPVLRGRDIVPYGPAEPGAWLRFAPGAFQQSAPERLYRAPEKLVYRFICDRLVVAHDARGLLALNSANSLIPRLPGMPAKVVLAFLNSPVLGYCFVKRHAGRKVLRGDLEKLPLPGLTRPRLRRMERLVERRLAGEIAASAALADLAAEAFGLSEAERKYVSVAGKRSLRKNRT